MANNLDALLAKQEITDRILDYCRAMDRMDDALGRSVFFEDATADYGVMYRGTGWGFVAFALGSHAGMTVHAHQVGNIRIELFGERAGSETYVTACLRHPGPEGALWETASHGRYVDQWERRDGRWAIARRSYLHAFDETRPVPAPRFTDDGKRDRSDPSYLALAGSW